MELNLMWGQAGDIEFSEASRLLVVEATIEQKGGALFQSSAMGTNSDHGTKGIYVNWPSGRFHVTAVVLMAAFWTQRVAGVGREYASNMLPQSGLWRKLPT